MIWFGHLGCLPAEIFWAHLMESKPHRRPRTRPGDYVTELTRKCLRIRGRKCMYCIYDWMDTYDYFHLDWLRLIPWLNGSTANGNLNNSKLMGKNSCKPKVDGFKCEPIMIKTCHGNTPHSWAEGELIGATRIPTVSNIAKHWWGSLGQN